MAKAYFIGGTPRVGKTTLLMRVIQSRPMLAASTDALRYTLRQVIKEQDQPDLFHLGKYTSNSPDRRDGLKSNPGKVIDIQNKESYIVWESVNSFVTSNLDDGFDVVIEGIAVLPELLKQVDYEYSAVFLGNQSFEHGRTILNSARTNPNDWMYTLEDETIEAFSIFNNAYSVYIQQQAEKFGFDYIEMGDGDFDLAIKKARNCLMS